MLSFESFSVYFNNTDIGFRRSSPDVYKIFNQFVFIKNTENSKNRHSNDILSKEGEKKKIIRDKI